MAPFQCKASPWKCPGSQICALALTEAAVRAALPQSWKTLPLNLVRQPFIKEPLPALGAWSLLFTHRPSLVVNMALFSQTKHRPSHEVARHTVWCAQTFRLLTGQLNPAVSSPCFTSLMPVYFYQPLWENCPVLWQLVADREFLIKIEIVDYPRSSPPFWVPELRGTEAAHPWKELWLKEAASWLLHGCDERKPTGSRRKAITNIWHVTN